MTLQGREPTSERPPVQDETVVTRGADHEIMERRSVGAAPAAVATPAPGLITSSRTIVRDEVAGQHRTVAQISQIIWFGVGLIEVVLALRLGLKLLAAGDTGFTESILAVTQPLVMPFLGIFSSAAVENFVFEPASAVAMVVYFLVGLGLTQFVRIMYGEVGEKM